MAKSAQEYQFGPDERPLFPGSPYSPRHSFRRKVAYALSGIMLTVFGYFAMILAQ